MKASEYGVVAFPKIDTEVELQRLRDRLEAGLAQAQPHIPLVAPLTPANLDELLSATEYISKVRRSLKPIAAGFRNCIERGESIVFACMEAADQLAVLHQSLIGSQPTSYLKDAGAFEPRLVVARIPDPPSRGQFMLEANRLGRIVALVDALTLVRLSAGGDSRPVARFPFGIGRVDYYEKLLP
jgi:hypothetical protein